ncbi:ras-interacting protein RIP3-like [Rhagoletis pomonella]|uniref:ras-interacting protein RIP3-like n=1 Tax=Rhagoletis pomonella TaxID=28610 RepID=UPI001781E0CA|nr:ras-interacting protein RIP3-like [Rhagoletis pomonella]
MDKDPGKNKDPPIATTAAAAAVGRARNTKLDDAAPAPIPAARTRRLNRTADASSSASSAFETAAPHASSFIEQKEEENDVLSEQLETSTITRTYTSHKIIHHSTEFHESSSSSSSMQYVAEEELDTPTTPSHRLRQKVAEYEKVWSSGGSLKRSPDESAEELRREFVETTKPTAEYTSQDAFGAAEPLDNPFDIDVLEIEKRLRRERQRGLAEAEAAKLAFQQVQLRHTPQASPRRVEVEEDYTAVPFNVTLRTTTKLSPGDESGYMGADEAPPLSPFNVTLRTTHRIVKKDLSTSAQQYEETSSTTSSPFNVTLRTTTHRAQQFTPTTTGDPKSATAQFLESEKTVRELHAVDGVPTIVTSSMTSDGRKHQEKIFRHGEGYVSPRCSPQRENRPFFESSESEREGSVPRSLSGRTSAKPPRSVDMTAGGRRILIRLEDETNESSTHHEIYDTTDSAVQARIRQLAHSPDGGGGHASGTLYNVGMETSPGNIDITVGSTHRHNHHHHQQQLHQQQTQPQQSGQRYYQQQRQRQEQQMQTESSVGNMVMETQKQKQQEQTYHQQAPWQMTESTTTPPGKVVKISTPTGETATGQIATGTTHTASTLETSQSHGSSTEESQRVVSRKKKTTTTTTTKVTTSKHASEERSELYEEQQREVNAGKSPRPTGLALSGANVRITGTTIRQSKGESSLRSELSDDSDTEGVATKDLVIVPTHVEPSQTSAGVSQSHNPSSSASAINTPTTTPSTTTASSTFGKSLTGHQTLQQQSTQDEYQEFQSTMAAINFARSNSQYDSHIREKRGKLYKLASSKNLRFLNTGKS